MRTKTWAAALLAAFLTLSIGTAYAADDADDNGDAQTEQPAKREFRPFHKILTLMPTSWGAPLLQTQGSFARFLRRHESGDEEKFESAPVPSEALPVKADDDLNLSNDFFFRPITGGATLFSVNRPGFSGRIVWGTDYRASTLNFLNPGIAVNPELADPSMATFTWSASTLRLEDAYDAYQLAPSAIYLSIRF